MRININSLKGVKVNGITVKGLKLNGQSLLQEEYPITYITTSGGSLYRTWDFFSFMLKPDGNYPTSYKSSEGATIDVTYTRRDKPGNGGEFTFYGYYKDINCTESFNGNIPIDTTGEVVIYAKFKMTATPFIK